MRRRSGVHPCQDPLGPAAHLRTDAPRGGSPDRQRRAVPGGADQAVRHLAGVLGARRRSGHPHHKTQAPGHRGQIRPTSSSPCTPEPARRRKPAELTPVAMPVLKSPGRTARRRQPPILSEPTSWHDRNRAEPDPMRAASRPEGMMATAPESAGICAECLSRPPGGVLTLCSRHFWVGEGMSFDEVRLDFCSRHLRVLGVGAAGSRLRQRAP
jgi:hypothetical protein